MDHLLSLFKSEDKTATKVVHLSMMNCVSPDSSLIFTFRKSEDKSYKTLECVLLENSFLLIK